jgi:hypothetical protein
MKAPVLWKRWKALKKSQGFVLGWVPTNAMLADLDLQVSSSLVDTWEEVPARDKAIFEELALLTKAGWDSVTIKDLINSAVVRGEEQCCSDDVEVYQKSLVRAISLAKTTDLALVEPLTTALILSLQGDSLESLDEVKLVQLILTKEKP